MQHRRNFLAVGCGLIAGGALLPVAEASAKEPAAVTHPKLIKKDEGQAVWVMAGVRITVKVRSADTGGAYAVFEDMVLPGAGPRLHTHTREQETLFVLEGTVRAWLGDRSFDVQPGTFVHMPLGVPHAFKNVSDKPARMLLSYVPGGFEKVFLEYGKPAKPGDTTPPKFTAEEINQWLAAAERLGVVYPKGA